MRQTAPRFGVSCQLRWQRRDILFNTKGRHLAAFCYLRTAGSQQELHLILKALRGPDSAFYASPFGRQSASPIPSYPPFAFGFGRMVKTTLHGRKVVSP
jgi:hypothetical protein